MGAKKVAMFAAGCFWGVEEAFRAVDGVLSTSVGYSGGTAPSPTYELVCSGSTGHAETVRVEYDPDRVSFGELLEVFWANHDPTQLNRQGPDIGTQYRSAIFVYDEDEERVARASLEAKQRNHGKPIMTQIVPASAFYRAEEYHQQFFEKRDMAHSR